MALRLIKLTTMLVVFLSIIINNVSMTSGALGDRLRQKEKNMKNKDSDNDNDNDNNYGNRFNNGVSPTSEPTEEPTEPSKFTCCSCTRRYNDMTAGYNACDDTLCVDMISVYYQACMYYEWDRECADAAQCICDGMDYNCNDDED